MIQLNLSVGASTSSPLSIQYRPTTQRGWSAQTSATISPRGIFIVAEEKLPVGTHIACEVSLGASVIVRGTGRVAWRRAESEDSDAGFGIHFDGMDDAVQRRVLNLIDSYLQPGPSRRPNEGASHPY